MIRFIVSAVILSGFMHSLSPAQVLTGADLLVGSDFNELEGKRVGLVMNQASVLKGGTRTTLDAIIATKSCTLTALYGPEHGIDGKTEAGQSVSNNTEPRTGVPVYSLYGATRKPTREMLQGVDVIVFDLQDIGIRSYTYISTMINVMEACAESEIPFYVLDRPNPIGGDVIDGNVLDTNFRSFVGILPVPYIHGMTAGELARMAIGERWLRNNQRCDLHVIPMKGWRRSMSWSETKLKWIPTSPNIPTPEAVFGCAVTGIIGELQIAHIGIQTRQPFQMLATDWMEGKAFAKKVNSYHCPGIRFSVLNNNKSGIRFSRTAETTTPFHASIALLVSLRDSYSEKDFFKQVSDERWVMFDKVCGTDGIRKALLSGKSYSDIVSRWDRQIKRFISLREQYLLYE